METVLHASLSQSGLWLLWGESAPLKTTAARKPRLVAASQDAIVAALEAAGVHIEPDPGDPPHAPLWLPVVGGSDLVASNGDPAIDATCRGYLLPCLQFLSPDLLDLLRLLPTTPPAGVRYGDSLQWLRPCFALGLELLAQGAVIPTFAGEAGKAPDRTVWLPILEAPGVQPRLRALTETAPAVLLAGIPSHEPLPAAEGLLAICVDSLARRFLAEAGWPGPAWSQPVGAAAAWLRSLAASDAAMRLNASQRRQLTTAMATWLSPLAGTADHDLVLVLQEPEGDGRWSLTYWVQSERDASLLLPAADVWHDGDDWVGDLKLHAVRPAVLARLGAAAAVFEPVRRSLTDAAPTGVSLALPEVVDLLWRALPVLREQGITVRVPDWWRQPTRPRVTMRLAPKESAGMGLSAIASFELQVALGDRPVDLAEVRALAAAKQSLVEVGGKWMAVDPDDLERLAAFMARRGTTGTVTPVEAVRLQDDLAGLADETITATGWVGDVLSGRLFERLQVVPVPENLQATLRPYQRRGLDWLSFCARLGIGACLADDMGLGKTVQVLALLLAARAAGEVGPTLLVAPMSVVGNWQREAARFAPDLQVHVHHGNQRTQGADLADTAATADLVITTYGLVVRDADSLTAIRWRRLVLDEAQHVKNPDAQQTRTLATIEADQRIALTGTPVENRLDELWSIMQLLNPGLLGSRQDFQARLAKPIEREGDPAALAQLRRLTGSFVLRRLKSDPAIIRDLPEKQEIKTFCNLTPEQASLYQAIVDDLLRRLDALAPMARRGAILATMTKLKQLCDHPALFLGDGSPLAGRSGKLEVLEDALTDILAAGDRALIFTQFAEMGHLLQPYLQRTFAVTVPFLHGGTAKTRRDRMVAEFQAEDGPQLMLLSLKAGGVGLNLTAANHVIHFDRWWNPAVETQATDRAYRIGQGRRVQVRPLICVGTLEEKIDQMLERKRDLADRVVGSGESWLTEMSTDQLREVLVLSRDAMMEA